MKKFFLMMTTFAMLAACAGGKQEKEADILLADQMRDIMIQLHLAEAKTNAAKYSPDTALMLYQRYKARILKAQKVDTATFNRSYRYYTQNVEEIDAIYEQVVDTLSLWEVRGYWPRPDSLKAPKAKH